MASGETESEIAKFRKEMETELSFEKTSSRMLQRSRLLAAGLTNESPRVARSHIKDLPLGVLDVESVKMVCDYARTEPYLKLVIQKIISDVICPYELRLEPRLLIPGADDINMTIPTILNAPVIMTERETLYMDVLKSLLVVGYVVVAVPADIVKHSLRDLALSSLNTTTNGSRTGADARINAPDPGSAFTTNPCIYIDPTHGQLQCYVCSSSHRVEWRFVPQSDMAMFYAKQKYRFEVYTASSTLHTYAPKPGYTAESVLQINTPYLGLYLHYAQYMCKLTQQNAVATHRSRALYKKEFADQANIRRADEELTHQETVHKHAIQNTLGADGMRTGSIIPTEMYSKSVPVALLNAMVNNGVNQEMIRMRSSGVDSMGQRTNLSERSSSSRSGNVGSTGVASTMEDETLPETYTLYDVSHRSLLQKLFQSLNKQLDVNDIVSRNSARPELGFVTQVLQAPEYVGEMPSAIEEKYQDLVLKAHAMSPLIFGNAKKTNGTGAAVAEVDAVVDKQYSMYLQNLQKELCAFTQWMYQICAHSFDKMAFGELMDLVFQHSKMHYDRLLRGLHEIDSMMQNSATVLETGPIAAGPSLSTNDAKRRSRATGKRAGAAPPHSVPSPEAAESERIRVAVDNDLSNKRNLLSALQMDTNAALTSYVKAQQFVFILSLAIYGGIVMDLRFVKAARSS